MLRPVRKQGRAFTLVELLVVIAIIALLISILLPSLARAREQAKKMKCLGNMKDLGAASNTYASVDANNTLVPVPKKRSVPIGGTAWFWGNELFGGKGGNPDFIEPQLWKYSWTAFRQFGPGDRPLNSVIAKSPSWISWDEAMEDGDPYTENDPRLEEHTKLDLPVFRCPSDVGLPNGRGALNPGWGDAWSQAEVPPDTPLYEVMGNSYATHWMTPLLTTPGPTSPFPFRGAGAVLREAEDVPRPSRCIIYREANARDVEFYNTLYSPWTEISKVLRINGWHGVDMEFNATFADGHAREISHLVRTNVIAVSPAGNQEFYSDAFEVRGCRAEAVLLPFTSGGFGDFIMRGDGWQLDFFPAPLARVINDQSEL